MVPTFARRAALAIGRAPIGWRNVRPTLPTERGLLPGNGSIVAALRGHRHGLVANKPAPALMTEAVARGGFQAQWSVAGWTPIEVPTPRGCPA